MYSSTTLDPENVLASGRVFLEDSPGIGCRAWERRVGPQALARCFSLSAPRASCHWRRQASCQFLAAAQASHRILALRFLKRKKAHARRGRAARGNNSRVMPSGTPEGSGRNPRVSLVPFKWLPNAAALHSEGDLSGVKREVSKGALQPNYKDEDEKPSCNLMYHSNAMAGIWLGLPRPRFKISDKEILQQHSFTMSCAFPVRQYWESPHRFQPCPEGPTIVKLLPSW